MAAIVEPSDGLDLKSFLSTVNKHLPSYAKPMFLRIVEELDITGTHLQLFASHSVRIVLGKLILPVLINHFQHTSELYPEESCFRYLQVEEAGLATRGF